MSVSAWHSVGQCAKNGSFLLFPVHHPEDAGEKKIAIKHVVSFDQLKVQISSTTHTLVKKEHTYFLKYVPNRLPEFRAHLS